MRIIAGAKRGMKLFGPETDLSRPITDRVKESLFSVLYKYDLPGGKIAADLFCGVGSLGLEALSRGAEFVTFVEKDPKIIATLKKNIEKAGFVKESLILRADAFKIGAPVDEQWFDFGLRLSSAECPHHPERLKGVEGKYDLIFVDPPYSTTSGSTGSPSRAKSREETKEGSPLSELLVLLSEQSAVGGIVVVRTERRIELIEQYGRLKVIERRPWGTMAVTILQRSSNGSTSLTILSD
jgi:16S rRNA (guanine966-N2)-methyltransferase